MVNFMNWLISVLLFFAYPAQAQEAAIQKLNEKVAALYEKGEFKQAIVIAEKAVNDSENTLGPNHPTFAVSLSNLANVNIALGQLDKAELLLSRSLTIFEKSSGVDHQDTAQNLESLSGLYKIQGKYSQAEVLLNRALRIYEKTINPDDPFIASTLNSLAELYRSQNLLPKAEEYYKRALAIQEGAKRQDHPEFAMTMGNLAKLYLYQGLYSRAEPLLKRSSSIIEKSLGPDHPIFATSLQLLTDQYITQGNYEMAEPLLLRSLSINEKSLGLEHPYLAHNLFNIGNMYSAQGYYTKAEPFLQRSLAINEKSLGKDHLQTGISLHSLGDLYTRQGKFSLSEPLLSRALAIAENVQGLNHPNIASILTSQANMKRFLGDFKHAEELFNRSIKIIESSFGSNHPSLSKVHNDLAVLYSEQGMYSLAITSYKRALTISEKSLLPNHSSTTTTLMNLADAHQKLGQDADALAYSRLAATISKQRILESRTNNETLLESNQTKDQFFKHLKLLAKNPSNEPNNNISRETFEIAQLIHSSAAALAINNMAARFSQGDEKLATFLRRKQDSTARIAILESRFLLEASKDPQKRSASAEIYLREEMLLLRKEIAEININLKVHFPQFQELSRVEPISIPKLQQLLKPGEAILVFALEDSSYGWVVTPKGSRFKFLGSGLNEITSKVEKIRSQLELDNQGQVQKIEVFALHELYNVLISPFEIDLTGVNHLMVVASGPLQSIPLSMLVRKAPPLIQQISDYRNVDWVAKHYALSVLPSVGSIQALRSFPKNSVRQNPFIGFGDPVIGEQLETTRSLKAKLGYGDIFRSLYANTASIDVGVIKLVEIADVDAIRNAPNLPETSDELLKIAKALNADPSSVWLRQNATETNVKKLDLSAFRTLAFATHGVMAGELKGVSEPGLILTPPKEGTLEDDGYLSSSEIAKLKLNADWVILSACNTAASDGTTGAEGLSGMAKAFFYAGARSLLVSHWPVMSEATVPLTTNMINEYAKYPKLGKAEAQRKAMINLMNSTKNPEYAHPVYWAPFVVVGEGGSIFGK